MRGSSGNLVFKFEAWTPTRLGSGPIFTRWKSNLLRSVHFIDPRIPNVIVIFIRLRKRLTDDVFILAKTPYRKLALHMQIPTVRLRNVLLLKRNWCYEFSVLIFFCGPALIIFCHFIIF